jgi:hypothetical protein
MPLQDPLDVQDEAFVVDHVKVESPPELTEVGLAFKVTLGAGLLIVVKPFNVYELTIKYRFAGNKPLKPPNEP